MSCPRFSHLALLAQSSHLQNSVVSTQLARCAPTGTSFALCASSPSEPLQASCTHFMNGEGSMHHGYLIDMDGVLYRGHDLIPGADAFVDELRTRGIPFRLLTNNSQR